MQFLGERAEKCEVLLQWIQRLVTEASLNGVVPIAAPILSRAFQELSTRKRVDVTAAMLDAAARTVAAFSLPNVELRRAALDDPSLGSGVADVVASNGVFNLTRDKRAAFAAAFRLLKPGGRLLLADVCKTGAPAS